MGNLDSFKRMAMAADGMWREVKKIIDDYNALSYRYIELAKRVAVLEERQNIRHEREPIRKATTYRTKQTNDESTLLLISAGETITVKTEAEKKALYMFCYNNGIKVKTKKQPDGTYRIWKT